MFNFQDLYQKKKTKYITSKEVDKNQQTQRLKEYSVNPEEGNEGKGEREREREMNTFTEEKLGRHLVSKINKINNLFHLLGIIE